MLLHLQSLPLVVLKSRRKSMMRRRRKKIQKKGLGGMSTPSPSFLKVPKRGSGRRVMTRPGRKAAKHKPNTSNKNVEFALVATKTKASTAASSSGGQESCRRGEDNHGSKASLATRVPGSGSTAKAAKESSSEKYTRKAREWLEDISVSEALEGASVGRMIGWAGETKKALMRHRGRCADHVYLESHIEAATVAEAGGK